MKLKIAFLNAVFLIAGFFNFVFSQGLQVSGNVKNKSNGTPLSGATIQVRGSKTNTLTDVDGNFQLNAVKKGALLVVTFTGMKPEEYVVENSTTSINIAMEEAATNLNEVVVIGYGTQKITKVSGAISTIRSADIEKLKPVRAEEALQGRASGVSVIQSGDRKSVV